MIGQRAASVWACTAWAWLATASEPLVTLEQGDAYRSPRAPRTVDVSASGRYIAFESQARLVPADDDHQTDVYVLDRITGQVTLESGSLDASTESAYPRISGDGRYLVFETRSFEVNGNPRVDIMLRDRISDTVRSLTRIAQDPSVYAWSRGPDISNDGQVVAFSSAATTLTSGVDANGRLEDIYIVRVPSGTIQRVSVNAAGVQLARGTSILPALSADGRWIAFASTAPLDTTAIAQQRAESAVRNVFLRDLSTGTTLRVSRTVRGAHPNGDSSVPAISGDGRYVVFGSGASNIAQNDENRGTDIFLFDRDTGSVSQISRAANGSGANGISAAPEISGDGRYIAFQSNAGNLVCASRCPRAQQDINLLWDAFVFDRVTGKTIRISEDELGGWMEWSMGPSIDATGRVVAFSSRHPINTADRLDDLDLYVRVLSPPAILTTKTP